MSQRLQARDLSLLAMESASTPMHNATLEIFEPGESGFDYQALVDLISDRIAFVPRYRQRVQHVPVRVANPIWVDDARFDLGFHVRRSGLPRPGSMDQLRELVGRIMTRQLDASRPLWEVYFIEGLADGRVAVLSKSHQILVDGVETVDLGQVLLDAKPETKSLEHDDWEPRRTPSPLSLATEALRDNATSPSTLVSTTRSTAESAVRRVRQVRHRAQGVANALTNRRPSPESPVSAHLSEQRRLVTVRTDLEDYRRIRQEHGGSVNDVILATLSGALRSWLMARGTPATAMRSLRAMVPMSVIDDELEATSLGTQIAGHLVTLPIGEASPVIRLHQVSYAFKSHRETGRAVAANRLAGIAGFAPTTFHALGSRVAALQHRKSFHLTVTNVPGPQFPLHAAGARMVETYPVQPLLPGQALAIGVTSYDGAVYYGITADRDALPDITVLGQCVTEALDELLDTASDQRPRAPRGRRTTKRVATRSGQRGTGESSS
ncbi:wax ester/triacylglycerol synthase family O-acyltransferase [Nocardioides sp. JQ2195]|uniref:WS/DGAT/MGAT family O-acyltransferase n=1 Tax=Nocardioides sp. JQ2195 TaxID=2592334 RepID=UPI00143EE2CF|nr:wax ester/triacylglycerol synthase family O-acyltransferase [Nocardioides sp. JQ2195]QIX25951.1 wax ester/triacylglycerol synthase family O-acyltransferase [Nocardioides sp. JQ2195]